MNRSRSRAVAVLLIVAAIFVLVLLRPTSEPDFDRIEVNTLADLEREFESLRERLGIPGMSAAIGEQGRVVWTRAFGWGDVERQRRVDLGTLFHLASVTKPYAATLVLNSSTKGSFSGIAG